MMNRKSQQIDDAFQNAFDPETDSVEWIFEFNKRINEAFEATAWEPFIDRIKMSSRT